eukprot:CAMPEP_0170225016 /NCGR_PEP_ID=MMETSP0116_2-20130129/12214_1 /TAXON_ID=400756 /ORGANISM="Durinskia baltica, Strain CSIRO CS-38" /LENGTH=978 /DNA_ID=CAMNT_0010475731 /DNA_START=21 /DNA_END=2957 /DNA_ORIENTATION=+
MPCCGGGGDDHSKEAFQKNGNNDLSEGLPQNRSCTDVFCIPIFIAFQLVFILATLAGMKDGDPKKLYKPRDYRGAYCGFEENWNGGPNTLDTPMLSFTMNLSAIVEPAMKQTICSSLAKKILTEGESGIPPVLSSEEDREDYLCSCCLIPCEPCSGTLEVGGDIATADDLQEIITGRMAEMTDPDKVKELYDPSSANGQMFSSDDLWRAATRYLHQVCVPDCTYDFNTLGANSSLAHRTHQYEPDQDTEFYYVWKKLKTAESNSLTAPMKDVLDDAFTFRALPESVCPYPSGLCVPMPGMEFEQLYESSDRCVFKMGKEVVAALGESLAGAMSGVGADAVASASTESFGDMVGGLQAALDTFIIVGVLSFVIGLVFLVLLRFFIGVCVWLAILFTIFMFGVGGGVLFVRSGQCKGAGLLDTGRQNAAAMYAYGRQTATDTINGAEPVDESMTGAGADYRGVQSRTINGRSCLMWDEQDVFPKYRATNYPEAALVKNYCRNPYREGDRVKAKTIWCVVGAAEMQWEECLPLGIIQPECKDGYAVEGETSRLALFVCSWIVWALGLIWILLVCCFYSRIQLAIALNKVAAQFLGSNPQTLLIPISQALLAGMWCLAWCMAASFLISQVPAGYTPTGYFETFEEAYGTAPTCSFFESGSECSQQGVPGKCTDKWPMGSVWKDDNCTVEDGVSKCWRCAPPRYNLDYRFAVSFFVFLWNNAFLVAMGQILIAMCVAIWFFAKERGKKWILPTAVKTIFRYHLGSVLFGSFIVAVVQFIRYCLKYLEKQAQAQKNRVMELILKALQCCMWCFEKCIKFLNKNAYIQICLTGNNFCVSAKTAFFLIFRNMVRFGVVTALGGIVHLIGFLFIVSGTCMVGYLMLRSMHEDVSPFVPLVCFTMIGYVVAELYLSVFSLAVDTSLQCFIVCEEMGEGIDNVPDQLKTLVFQCSKGARRSSDKSSGGGGTASQDSGQPARGSTASGKE